MRVIVVGGGVAGLTAAWKLSKLGLAVELYESSNRLGGLIQSIDLDGTSLDVGAEAFAVARPDTLELIADLGLSHLVEEPANSEARILVDGRVIKIPHGVLGIPSDLDSEELIEAIGPEAVLEAKRLDAQPWSTKPNGTLADLVRDRLGESVLRTLVTPVVAGVHASDPNLLEADAVAPGLFARAAQLGSLSAAAAAIRATAARPGAAVATLAGGMMQLIQGLERAVTQAGVTLHLSTPVTRVEQNQDGYRLSLGIPTDEQQPQADLLVVAVPPAVAAKILSPLATLAEPLARIPQVDVTVVALSAENSKLARAPLGSGVLVAPGNTAVSAKASTHTSAKWDSVQSRIGENRHLVRLSYGRNGLAPAASPDLVKTAKQDAVRLFGFNEADIREVAIQEWPQSLVQARTGHRRVLDDLGLALRHHPQLGIVGAGLGGNGITGILAKTNTEIERITSEIKETV